MRVNIYFVKGYVLGRCISKPIKLEVLKYEINDFKNRSISWTKKRLKSI